MSTVSIGSRRSKILGRRFVALTVAIVLAATACSSDKKSSSTAAATTAAVTTAASTSAAPGTTGATGSPGTSAGTEPTSAPSATSAASTTAPAATPTAPADADTNGTLRVMFTAPPDTMDPDKSFNLVLATAYQFPVFDRLTQIDKNLVVQPMLATSWKFSADGKSLELKLRTDVKFHSGNPVNAAAVKASLERGKTLDGSTAAPAMQTITSVDAVDDSTVRLNLSAGDASLPAKLAGALGSVMDPAVFNDPKTDMATNPSMAGSGPYVVSNFVPNQSATYDRAPGTYWDPAAGQLKSVTISFIADQAARINGIRSGATDMAFINVGQTQNVADIATGKYTLHRIPGNQQVVLWFNDTKNQFANPMVRQAVKEAIDPETIANDLLNGDCKTDPSIYPPASWAHAALDDKHPYNVDQAKKDLAAAGVTDLSFTAFTNAGTASNDVSVAVQAQLQKAGISMQVQPNPTAANQQLYVSQDYEAFINSIAGTADPDGVLANMIVGGYKIAGKDIPALQAL
jgi:peptide/nickel transport system substrate-binding protein